MTKHVVGSKILKKEQILISIFLITILVLSSCSMVAFASGSHTIVVKPNGTDDTAAIQAALNACTGKDPNCTVQLMAGTYHISQIAVFGFQGKFVGMGQGVTTIQALPNLKSPNPLYNTPSSAYWAEPPGPSNHWPALFAFLGGSFSVSQMTITDEYPAPLAAPGWTCCGFTTYYTALDEAILIAGQQASVTIDHVSVIGTSGDEYGTNINYAIELDSHMLPEGWTDPLADMLPLSGTFSVTNSVFNTVATGPGGSFLTSASVTFCNNKFTNSPYPMYLFDLSNTKVLACGNQATNVQNFGSGFTGLQSVFKSGLLPSTVYVTDNDFQTSEASNGAYLADLGETNFGTPSTLSAVVSGNTFTTDSSCGCYQEYAQYTSVIASFSLANIVASQNKIYGGGTGDTSADAIYITGGPGQISGNTITGSYNGVWVDTATDVQLTHDTILGSANYGIALTDGSSSNLVAHNFVMHSGVYDLYQDASSTGTGNVWFGNICQTSSPSGLC